ncbi:MAG: hypothetical protein HOB63_00175 [Opitutae bacterium]|jgi:hypothetical protein|nr:hypothetical protein [Opitutae bacterium]
MDLLRMFAFQAKNHHPYRECKKGNAQDAQDNKGNAHDTNDELADGLEQLRHFAHVRKELHYLNHLEAIADRQ